MIDLYYPTAAERLAASAWKRLKLAPPCDLRAVCEFLGIKVFRDGMPNDMAGIYIRNEDGVAEIHINSWLTPVQRQRFTWAHETRLGNANSLRSTS